MNYEYQIADIHNCTSDMRVGGDGKCNDLFGKHKWCTVNCYSV